MSPVPSLVPHYPVQIAKVSDMKISELSLETGAPLATIKYYLREGMLPAGERSAPNQARYDESHVRRIHLIRALTDIGGLPVAEAKKVLAAIDAQRPLTETLEIAQNTVSEHIEASSIDSEALAIVDELIADWSCDLDDPGRSAAARVVMNWKRSGQDINGEWMSAYAAAAQAVAEADLDLVESRMGLDAQAETVVVGTVLGDALFAALRRSAQAAATVRRYGDPRSPRD